MGPHVIFQHLTMNERIVTLSTLVCFLSSVGLHVSLLVVSLCAGKVALYTSERFFSRMYQFVFLQSTGCCTRIVAV